LNFEKIKKRIKDIITKDCDNGFWERDLAAEKFEEIAIMVIFQDNQKAGFDLKLIHEIGKSGMIKFAHQTDGR
jgi:hypothetical protein